MLKLAGTAVLLAVAATAMIDIKMHRMAAKRFPVLDPVLTAHTWVWVRVLLGVSSVI